jgi:hypothetical protein
VLVDADTSANDETVPILAACCELCSEVLGWLLLLRDRLVEYFLVDTLDLLKAYASTLIRDYLLLTRSTLLQV